MFTNLRGYVFRAGSNPGGPHFAARSSAGSSLRASLSRSINKTRLLVSAGAVLGGLSITDTYQAINAGAEAKETYAAAESSLRNVSSAQASMMSYLLTHSPHHLANFRLAAHTTMAATARLQAAALTASRTARAPEILALATSIITITRETIHAFERMANLDHDLSPGPRRAVERIIEEMQSPLALHSAVGELQSNAVRIIIDERELGAARAAGFGVAALLLFGMAALDAASKLRRHREALEQAKSRMQALTGVIPGALAVIGQDLQVLQANSPFLALDGAPRPNAQAIGMHLCDVLAETGPIVLPLVQSCLDGLVPRPETIRLPSGRTWTITVSSIPHGMDEPGAVALHGTDITDICDREAHLARTDANLGLLLEAGPLGFWRWYVPTDTFAADHRWHAMLGYGGGNLPPKPIVNLVHPEDQSAVDHALADLIAGRVPQIRVEHRILHEDSSWRWVMATARVTERDPAGNPLHILGAHIDITPRKSAEADLQLVSSEAAATLSVLDSISKVAPIGLALLDADLRLAHASAEFALAEGRSAASMVQRPIQEGAPILHDRLREAITRAMSDEAEPDSITFSVPSDDPACPTRHYVATCFRLQGPGRHNQGLGIALHNITDKVVSDRSAELLVGELNHRVKNTLANVQALMRQQGRFLGEGAADVVECLTSRIQALATSHDLLVHSAWTGADIHDLVHRILAPWADDARFTICGPSGVNLTPKQAQGLVLGLHELATNAVKYGALSTAEGEVTLIWSGIGNILQLNWTERGGPLITGQPSRLGFGTRLLERMLPGELGPQASVNLRYDPTGVSATIRVPIIPADQPQIV